MADIEPELHATIDAITSDVARLKRVQARKQALPASDPRATVLANEAVEIATTLLPKTVAERKLVEESVGD